jgi:predicted DNA binding protein|tara:strand:+ start:537 stop:755 length:219 start_codon:yes stop_codon:yes gene_type:complete
MKNKAKNPYIVGLQDKEDKNTARALRTESMKMALASSQEGEDPVKKASRIYKFIEYGSIELTEKQTKALKNA